MELELRINGVIKSVEVAPNESLIGVLRREGYLSVKQGCETSECGACTILVDGAPRPSCVMLAAQAGGCTLTTVESLASSQQLHPLQEAFIDTGAIQCGFCTPGMLLSAHALLQRNPSPSEAEVREALSGHLCRCTGYGRPVQAVLRAAAVQRGEKVTPLSHSVATEREPWQPGLISPELVKASREAADTSKKSRSKGQSSASPAVAQTREMEHVGQPERRVDAVKFATGLPAFTDDFEQHGHLYARLLTSPHAHATIRDIDVSEARSLPGVHAVLTYKDVPRISHSTAGQPWPNSSPRDRFTLDYTMRYVGDRVAVVAADTPEIAEEALGLIQVEYEVQAAVFDPRQALDPQAPRIHPETDAQQIFDASRNLAVHTSLEVGEMKRGFGEADIVVEAEYSLPAVQQVPLEKHSVVTCWDENKRLVVYTSSDAPFHVRRLLAEATGLPPQRIRVVRLNVGGSFGSKQDLLLEDLCALLTLETGRPVRMVYSRAEELRDGGHRHAQMIHLKTGVKRDGRIVANQMTLLTSAGAYAPHAETSQRNAGVNLLALYPCPNQRFTAETVYTNLPPASSAPGHGVSQGFFALESHLDEIARQLKIAPLELRRRNWVRPGTEPFLSQGLDGRIGEKRRVLASSSLPQCLKLVEEKIGSDANRQRNAPGRYRKGVGFALAMYNEGALPRGVSGANITLNEDGSFRLLVSMADSVVGASTLFAQLAAEELGVEMDAIIPMLADTDSLPFETNLKSSLALAGCVEAVKQAAREVRQQLLEAAGKLLQTPPAKLSIRHSSIEVEQGPRVPLADVAMSVLYGDAPSQVTAQVSLVNQDSPTAFAAQGVEVEVDTETGAMRVLRIVTAVEAGDVINPVLTTGQIEGVVVQALGQCLSEELRYDQQGRLLTNDLSTYRILRAIETPALETHLVKPENPADTVLKSVEDVVALGVAPAVTNAVADALNGVRIRQLPLTPERVLRAIHGHQAQQQQQQQQATKK